MPAPIRIEDVVAAGVQAALDGVHVSLPGIVVRYDALTCTADVQPGVSRVLLDPDTGERTVEQLPIIPAVPVAWPAGGGYAVTMPLTAGDPVLLVFSESSTVEWRQSNQPSEPGDLRRHSLGYPIAVPGGRPLSVTDAAPRAVQMILGESGGENQVRISPAGIQLGASASQPIALAPGVLTALAAINTYLVAVNAAITAKAGGPPATTWPDMVTVFGTAIGALTTALTAAATSAVPAVLTRGE